MRVATALAIICTSSTVSAQTPPNVEASAQNAYELARSFSECAGFYDALSLVEDVTGNSASAQNAHNISNGQRLSAGYVLSLRHRLQRPDEPPRTYGSWDEFIEPLAEVTATRMMAAIEQQDSASIERQSAICGAMAETADGIVNQIRAERSY